MADIVTRSRENIRHNVPLVEAALFPESCMRRDEVECLRQVSAVCLVVVRDVVVGRLDFGDEA